jgi:hypothetical protein
MTMTRLAAALADRYRLDRHSTRRTATHDAVVDHDPLGLDGMHTARKPRHPDRVPQPHA